MSLPGPPRMTSAPGPPIEGVVAGAADEEIVAVAAAEEIVVPLAKKLIAARTAIDAIVAGTAMQVVAEVAGKGGHVEAEDVAAKADHVEVAVAVLAEGRDRADRGVRTEKLAAAVGDSGRLSVDDLQRPEAVRAFVDEEIRAEQRLARLAIDHRRR